MDIASPEKRDPEVPATDTSIIRSLEQRVFKSVKFHYRIHFLKNVSVDVGSEFGNRSIWKKIRGCSPLDINGMKQSPTLSKDDCTKLDSRMKMTMSNQKKRTRNNSYA